MDPIVSRDTINDLARAAADSGQDIDGANPYPAGTAAHDLWLISYRLAVDEREVGCVHGLNRPFFCPTEPLNSSQQSCEVA